MKEVSYKPTTEGFEGEVTIDRPSFQQRMRYIVQCNFETSQDGQMKFSMANADGVAKMVDLAGPHIKKVCLKSRNATYNSFEELLYETECDALVVELAGAVMSGVKLGGTTGQG